jgi:lysophospholipase L1-like esterase
MSTFPLYKGSIFDAITYNALKTDGTIRKLYCLGDSITRGMYAEQGASSSSGPTDKGYPYWIGRLTGYDVENLGVSGSGWANKGGNNDQESGEVNSKTVVDANTFADADIITLAFGVNDWKGAAQSVVLGDMSSVSGDGTVIGNMKYCIETLVEKKPTAQIIVLLPLNTNRKFTGMRDMTLEENWAFGYAYRNNQTLQDYRTAIRQCAEYYNIKVVDLEEVCPINRLNLRNMCGDGLHPTKAFYRQMGEALTNLVC